MGLYLWDILELDKFRKQRLPSSRKGTSWLNILKALTCYRLIDPGSEFRFHREWYLRSAMGDLLGEDYSLAQKDKPYRCLDLLLKHRGIPTEKMLEKMRSRGIDYLVGTPKGHLTHVEKPLLEQTWIQARDSVRVKIFLQELEFSVYKDKRIFD